MNREEALDMIKKALENTSPGLSVGVCEDTHLIESKIIESLEAMSFLFELEQLRGSRIDEIDETFDDFRVSRMIDILTSG